MITSHVRNENYFSVRAALISFSLLFGMRRRYVAESRAQSAFFYSCDSLRRGDGTSDRRRGRKTIRQERNVWEENENARVMEVVRPIRTLSQKTQVRFRSVLLIIIVLWLSVPSPFFLHVDVVQCERPIVAPRRSSSRNGESLIRSQPNGYGWQSGSRRQSSGEGPPARAFEKLISMLIIIISSNFAKTCTRQTCKYLSIAYVRRLKELKFAAAFEGCRTFLNGWRNEISLRF